jgi:hypothetical protein
MAEYDLTVALLGVAGGLLAGASLGTVAMRYYMKGDLDHQKALVDAGRTRVRELDQALEAARHRDDALTQQYEAAVEATDDYERQLDELHDGLQRQQQHAREQQRKLQATIAQNKQLHRALEEAYGVAETLHAEAAQSSMRAAQASSRIPTERRHTVFLDGMTSSGKTTLVQHLTNPTVTRHDLLSQMSTAFATAYEPLPLCVSDAQTGRLLHTLSFYDTVGEKPQSWTEGVLAHPTGGAGTGKAVSLLIWDLSASVEVNLGYLSEWRVKATYGLPPVRSVIEHVVVLFNKNDHAAARGQDVERLIARVRDELFGVLDDPPPLSFCVGSAVTGEGLRHVMGALITGLGLADHYRRAPRAPSIARAAE